VLAGAVGMETRSSGGRKPSNTLADERFRRAFVELRTGIDYAEMTSGDAWDYAVEIYVLRRFGLSDNDLRVLLQKRFVEHAQEVTTQESVQRAFRRVDGVALTKRTCFVLTPLGIAKAHSYACQPAQPDPVWDRPRAECSFPSWNAAQRLLSYGGQTVKHFRRPAMNQELVLSAFEEEGWPHRILSPLAPTPVLDVRRRLCDTIKSLNRGQILPLIHFHGDGTGEGVLWEPAAEDRLLRSELFCKS
jgi:hypothetical protein